MQHPLPRSHTHHPALTAKEQALLADVVECELTATTRHGLLVVVESVIAGRVPGYRKEYTKHDDSAQWHGAALCAARLHPDLGSTPDECAKGREWLKTPQNPEHLLAFYFRINQLQRQNQRAAAIQRLDLIPTT